MMIHQKLDTSQLVAFDITDKGFEAGGIQWVIYSEKMAVPRVKAFHKIIDGIEVESNEDILKFLREIYGTLTGEGEDHRQTALYAFGTAARLVYEKIEELERDSLKDIKQQNYEEVLELCAQFIYKPGEDITKALTPDQLKEKKDIWRDCCDYNSLLFCAISQSDRLAKQLSIKPVEVTEYEDGELIKK